MKIFTIFKQIVLASFIAIVIIACSNQSQSNQNESDMNFSGAENEVKLMILDPGHFHAALVQKKMYEQVDPVVHVYSPEGPDVDNYQKTINNYNSRPDSPTKWITELYTGPDFAKKMLSDRPGNVMVTSGNNGRKTEYIIKAVDSSINVFADKPMAINREDFELLKQAFEKADENDVLIYDIMTERFEITTLLQKELSMIPEVFGSLTQGSLEEPAVVKESVHHFFKYISGNKIKRPPWFFDVTQQGEGVVDVTTHLVDLVQWECFPEQIIDYRRDIELISASRWPTNLTPTQFNTVTQMNKYPDYFRKNIVNDSILQVYANGEINYTIKGVHAKVSVVWNYQAPEGTGDTHYSIMKGSKSNLVIKQGAEQDYKPKLYIEPTKEIDSEEFEIEVNAASKILAEKYPGLEIHKSDKKWEVLIPDKYKTGHEAHFAQVTEKFIQYLTEGKLPDWEVPNMITKYNLTTQALEMALNTNNN